MLKKILAFVVMLYATMTMAFAAVDANKATDAQLDAVKGIGPVTSKAIIDARKKGGDFKDWSDFIARVKGIGDKKAESLSKEGLTVNGTPCAGASMKKDDKKDDKKDAKATAKEEKKEPKADAKAEKKATEAKKDEKEAKAEAKKEAAEAKADAKKAKAAASAASAKK